MCSKVVLMFLQPYFSASIPIYKSGKKKLYYKIKIEYLLDQHFEFPGSKNITFLSIVCICVYIKISEK